MPFVTLVLPVWQKRCQARSNSRKSPPKRFRS